TCPPVGGGGGGEVADGGRPGAGGRTGPAPHVGATGPQVGCGEGKLRHLPDRNTPRTFGQNGHVRHSTMAGSGCVQFTLNGPQHDSSDQRKYSLPCPTLSACPNFPSLPTR